MKQLADFIVRFRYVVMAVFIALAALCAFLSTKVVQNYDMSKYLGDGTETKDTLQIMGDEFGYNTVISVMLKNCNVDSAKSAANELNKIKDVTLATFDGVIKNNSARITVNANLNEYSEQAIALVADIRACLDSLGVEYVVSGTPVSNAQLSNALGKEIPIIMAVAIAVMLVVLLLTSHSFFEPVVFLLTLLVAVLLNMGTNVIFDEISYITQAVAAILQLALTMDYSIMLIKKFSALQDRGLDAKSAASEALASSFKPISGSALTTVAGLLALVFMSFTIGRDLGIVLAKAIILSMLCVFGFMPSLLVLFEKPIAKLKHKPIKLGGEKVAAFSIKLRKVLPPVLLVVIIAAAAFQTTNTYSYSAAFLDSGRQEIDSTFGSNNQVVLLYNNELNGDDEAMLNRSAALGEFIRDYTIDGESVYISVTSAYDTVLSANELLGSTGLPPELAATVLPIIGLGEQFYPYQIHAIAKIGGGSFCDGVKNTALTAEKIKPLIDMVGTRVITEAEFVKLSGVSDFMTKILFRLVKADTGKDDVAIYDLCDYLHRNPDLVPAEQRPLMEEAYTLLTPTEYDV